MGRDTGDDREGREREREREGERKRERERERDKNWVGTYKLATELARGAL